MIREPLTMTVLQEGEARMLYGPSTHGGMLIKELDATRKLLQTVGTEPIEVVAAVRVPVGGRRDLLWVVRRTEQGSHGGLAGMWEYPGGKVEALDLSLQHALRREMREEFGVGIDILQELDTITTSLNGKSYRVHFFMVAFQEQPELRVHDAEQWCTVGQLRNQLHLPSGTEFNRRLRVYTGLVDVR